MKILGDFEYDPANVLGNGAFAIVYKGHFRSKPSVNVAIKIMLKDQNIIKAKSLLGKEISVLKDLNHEHIVKLYSHNISSSGVYLVMEYCNCGDLSEYLQIKKILPESTIKHILFQIGSAMEAMFKKKIMHRDLKPGNILLSYYGERNRVSEIPGNQIVFKLADFGFARFLPNGIMAVTMCGSPMYMAPEVLMSKKYNALADIWSMGIIVYQCLTGKAAFYANTPEALKKIYETNYNLRPKIPETCSRELADLLVKMLKRDPLKRINFDNFLSHPFIQSGIKKPTIDMLGKSKPNENLLANQRNSDFEIGCTKTLPGIDNNGARSSSNTPKNIRNDHKPRSKEPETYLANLAKDRKITMSESIEYEYSPTLNFNYDSSQNFSDEFTRRDETTLESDGYLYDDDEIIENRANFGNTPVRTDLPKNDGFIIIDKDKRLNPTNRVGEPEKNPSYPQPAREHSIASPNQTKNKYTPQQTTSHQTKFSSEIASIVKNQSLQEAQRNNRLSDHKKLETIVGSPNIAKNTGFVENEPNPNPHNSDHFLGLGMPKHHALDGEFSIESEDPQHCDELNKIIMVLELCELLSELAERRAAALSDCTANNNTYDFSNPANSSPSKQTIQYNSEAQRIVEQIVLYQRILYYLKYVFVQVKKGMESGILKTTESSIKRVCECNSLYHRSYIRLRQLAKQIQREDLSVALSHQLTCITANRLIYQHTFDQCLAAEMDEYIGEIRLCLQRYNAAIILLHGLTQHAKASDRKFLNECMKMIRDRSTMIFNQHSNQKFSTQNIVFNEFLPGLGDVPPSLYLAKNPYQQQTGHQSQAQ